MGERTHLCGPYKRIDLAYLRQRANNRQDERHIFYQNMLQHDSYEAYLAAVEGIKAFAPSFGEGRAPITGRAEILYARRFHRIADVAK